MRILVGYNGSESSRKALVHAAELVGHGGELDVIHVIAAQPVSARIDSLGDSERRRQDKLLRDARMLLTALDVRMHPVKAIGDPSAEIRAAAEDSGATLIVVGRGSGLRRLINGSVSTRLVRRAPSDVLVVH